MRLFVANLSDALLTTNKKIIVSSFICVFYNNRGYISHIELPTGRHHILGVVPKGSTFPLDVGDLVWPEGRLHDILVVVDAVVCDSVWVSIDDFLHPVVVPV